ncbi:MAG TPA: hypothetical protein VK735_40015 [Pseudonocardia sp.]|uniref:hypothetical protein n=1 Tax=Pseudonocardia sp. TaxID=60912 RepID=UPI002C9F31A9|nr:hypothetical protein [Pseudonocardia sp.]HTF53671.1 hypothetical protein [Pseudonocardia sp.]
MAYEREPRPIDQRLTTPFAQCGDCLWSHAREEPNIRVAVKRHVADTGHVVDVIRETIMVWGLGE